MARRLVGRSKELGALTGAVDHVASRRGGLVAVTGEAGVGKSRLVAELCAVADARRLAVLTGRAVEASTSPLRPVAEAFLGAFRDRPPPADPELAPFRAALGNLVPEWRSPEPVPTEPLVRNEGVLRLLRALGGGAGCLFVLEDLHWADPETLGVVEHLAAHGGPQRVLCLVTARSEQSSPGLELVRALAVRGAAEVVHLGRLDDAEIAELARAAGGELDPAAERIVCERAEGLPLLAEDLVATSRTTGAPMAEVVPLTFAGTVHRRLAALGHDALTVVRAAAVLGRRFDWRLLATVTGLDDATVATVLRAAADAHLVGPSADGGFAFRHALTRDAVLADLLPTERSRLAAAALAAVEDAHPGLPGDWCELAAALAEHAGDGERATTLLVESARRALDGGALAAAEATLVRAGTLAGADEDAVFAVDHLRLEVFSLAGKTDLALDLGASLLARRPPLDAAAIHLRLARAAAGATRADVARRHLAEARRLAPAGSGLVARVDALAATVAISEGRSGEAVDLAEGALAAGRASGAPEAVCEALEVLGRAARRDDLDRAEALFARAAEAAGDAGLRLWEIRSLHELGTIDMLRTSKLDRLERARDLASDAGALAIAAIVDLQLASSYALRFQPERALQAVCRGAEIAGLFDLGLVLPMLRVQAATAHATAGRRADMEAAIEEAVALSGGHAEVWTAAWGHARVLLALLGEDRAAAHAALREALAWFRRPECGVAGAFAGWLALVATLDDADGTGGGTTRAEVRGLPGMGISLNAALLGHAEAVALGRAGRGDEATALAAAMDADLAAKEGSDGWRHLSRRLVAEAAVADGWGTPVEWLREALGWFESRGHAAVVAACRALLVRAGAPVPRHGRGDSEVPSGLRARGVTSREVDVLALVAQGLSNGEIAERLYLSARTVEKHVERLRDKTGAASRAELAGVAAKYGAGVP